MPIIMKTPVEFKSPQENPDSDYVWDRKSRKLVRKSELIAIAKDEYYWDAEKRQMVKRELPQEEPTEQIDTYWDKEVKQLVTKPEPAKPVVYKRMVPSKPMTKQADHYVKVEDGSLHKYYNTKSQYLKDMAALDIINT